MKANDGLLRYEDMAAFKLQPEEPVSTDYRGFKVYKPGFWSQGPTMIEALNILEGFDLRSLGINSAEYIHKTVEALKLAYADRDTYYGDPKFINIPTDVLLSKTYAAERRKLITARASLDFVPGVFNGRRGRHPTEMEIARTKIDDELMASDTTCVDAIDKDGMVFSATPSGAWLPSVVAGDTGIPLTERAQQFLLVPEAPNELAGGKRPRVTHSVSPYKRIRRNRSSINGSVANGHSSLRSLSVQLRETFAQILRIHSHGFADVDERKGPFRIVFKNPFVCIFEETIGLVPGVFLKAFDRIQQNRKHECLFRLQTRGAVPLVNCGDIQL